MKEVEFIHTDNNLDDLFSYEGELLSNINQYCADTSKQIVSSYYISNEEPYFKLTITITQK
tara:strand:+ start:12248 stop:12430 length:183 start_codon:yes stop_codon:yes gene_type:complete